MLGHYEPVQNFDMELECELASRGLQLGEECGLDASRQGELREASKDWRLLLQLDTDDTTGWAWGDLGKIYFWIREADARVGDFSQIRLMFDT